MMRLACTVAALSLLLQPAAFADGPWELVGTKDDVVTYRRETAGSPVVAIKGEGTVDASIVRVASVLLDTARLAQWMDGLAAAWRLHSTGLFSYIEYDRVSVPFPLTDREFVVESRGKLDPANKRIILTARSVQDPSAPVTKLVRGDVHASTFILTAVDGGRRTHVVAEAEADPKGAIPKWVINYFQTSWAHSTIMGLRAQVRRPDVGDDPELKRTLELAGFFQ